MYMLRSANLTTPAFRSEEILSRKFFSIFLNLLFCITSSQIQENPLSLLGLEPTRNIPEFTVVPNVTALSFTVC